MKCFQIDNNNFVEIEKKDTDVIVEQLYQKLLSYSLYPIEEVVILCEEDMREFLVEVDTYDYKDYLYEMVREDESLNPEERQTLICYLDRLFIEKG
jgi:hypothetical protein